VLHFFVDQYMNDIECLMLGMVVTAENIRQYSRATAHILRKQLLGRLMKNDALGTQTLARAVAVLKHLGASGSAGLRVSEVQVALGLTRPTTYRILNALVEHGLTSRDSSGRRYLLGPELALLARAAVSHTLDLQKLCQNEIIELARETGDTSFLLVRSGYELVCVDLKNGTYPIQTMTAAIGTRRPVGIGAAGVAVLAALDEDEASQALKACKQQLGEYARVTEATISSALRQARKQGYALSVGMVHERVSGVAVAVMDRREPIASLLVTSISERISASRIPTIVAALNKHKLGIERKVLQHRELTK
jgi:DNA-binding IclR family transcriptional regulator